MKSHPHGHQSLAGFKPSATHAEVSFPAQECLEVIKKKKKKSILPLLVDSVMGLPGWIAGPRGGSQHLVQIWTIIYPLPLELPLTFNPWWLCADCAGFLSHSDFCFVHQ